MRYKFLASTTLALLISLLTSCKQNHKPDLGEILSSSPDSIVSYQISKFLKLDSIHAHEFRVGSYYSRFFPTNWPLGSDSTLTLIATEGSVCTYFRESVYNYSCTWLENKPEPCVCMLGYTSPATTTKGDHINQIDTIDSFQEFQNFVKEKPNGIRHNSRIRGFTTPESEVDFEDGEKTAFKIKINVFRPEPENWQISVMRCPQSEWLIETDSVVFNAATAALVRSIKQQTLPSPEEKDTIRNYYLVDLIDYRSKNFKHLLPGQREFLDWLTSN
ncbi:MAG: hypothetical protein IPK50_15380 [Fibrobacterota bacterium]|nr:hypothetical protein [Fibrobacterota bacterium]QQS03674.1 MAG: hypothetical protein IPK50_15380 [Fibrobacterota bacterium]